jgi:Na+-translocating ferredoxin:NAD+ oxidoreductase RnfD subunit
MDDPWREVKTEGERIQERMGTISKWVQFLPIMGVFTLCFLIMTGFVSDRNAVGAAVSGAVCAVLTWFGRKYLRGDDDVDVGGD